MSWKMKNNKKHKINLVHLQDSTNPSNFQEKMVTINKRSSKLKNRSMLKCKTPYTQIVGMQNVKIWKI